MIKDFSLQDAPLNKKTPYIAEYKPDLLFPISRASQRVDLGVTADALPFQGNDVWNAFEISWLNAKGKPIAAIGEFEFPCESPYLIESKSFKLYLNSFNNTVFDSFSMVESTLIRDLSKIAGAIVKVSLYPLANAPKKMLPDFDGFCLDGLDVTCDIYSVEPNFLKTENETVSEALYSHLLKSNCPVTGQPDWASVLVNYTGKKINREGLLKYFVSFRNHAEFHEQCVEHIFIDMMKHCEPEKLLVYARYIRRGGLDINPYRANYKIALENIRIWRQ